MKILDQLKLANRARKLKGTNNIDQFIEVFAMAREVKREDFPLFRAQMLAELREIGIDGTTKINYQQFLALAERIKPREMMR